MKIVATGVALLGILNIIRVIVQTAQTFAGDGWSTGTRAVFLALNAIPLGVSVFYVPLAYQITRGRPWAWVTAIVLISLTTVAGAFMMLIMIVGGSPLLGLVWFFGPLAVLLGLTVPRSVRAFFPRRPQPVPYAPYPPQGPWTS
ncbi:hypothetical protein [Actinoplanes philippinensis]|uniref:hypothetical protein n=1 Tax=Actinoplanes philippinensis TaxID=35752 RepID=UPI0033DC0D78